jgi:hypothetical protein
MPYQSEFIISDTEVEQALAIVVYYFERKYGALSLDAVEHALFELYQLFRKEKKCNPLLLANKAIPRLEHQLQKRRAA